MPRKHKIECPHCRKLFEWSAPVKKKDDRLEHNLVYTASVDFWLKELHPGWSFTAVHGKSLKSLLMKLKAAMKASRKIVYSESEHIRYFKLFCQNLPEWFKDKDLQVLNSKLNEIIEQLKKGKQTANGYHNKTSGERYNEAASRYKI